MSDPQWTQVFGNRLAGDLPPVPKQATPTVRTPTCPAHCSGKHEEEARIGCRRCQAEVFRVIAHEWATQDGHYFYTREPLQGAPPELQNCPVCRYPLQRMP